MVAFMSAEEAAKLDEFLMSSETGYSIDQLMELAGLSVASALQKLHPTPCSVLVICGPGNNGGDGLVAARHLKFFGYLPTVLFPKQKSGPGDIYDRSVKQLKSLDVPVMQEHNTTDMDAFEYIVDAIFGFSFNGAVRAPFDAIIDRMKRSSTPVLSVDVPSSWSLDAAPTGTDIFYPSALISLSAPKPCSRGFKGRHFLGGRFLPIDISDKYELPKYHGAEQVLEILDTTSMSFTKSKQ